MIDLQAKWLAAGLDAAADGDGAKEQKQKLIQLQRSRLRFDELGAQLEAYDAVLPPASRSDELTEAALCYRSSGNTAAELRVLQLQNGRAQLDGPLLERYSKLLIAKPQTLVATIARERRGAAANGMLNYAVQHASAGTAQQAIAARGVREEALWTKAYTGLMGLVFRDQRAGGERGVHRSAGRHDDRLTVGQAGESGATDGRRSVVLLRRPFRRISGGDQAGGAEDYLPAMVEATPARSDAYFAMAEYFHDAGDDAAATADYGRALELDPTRADVHDRLATIAARAGQHRRSDSRMAAGDDGVHRFDESRRGCRRRSGAI